MSLNISITGPANAVVEGDDESIVITVTNPGTSAVTMTGLVLSCPQGTCVVSQPVFYTPNLPPGVGNPVIGAGASASYFASIVVRAPYFYGSVPMAGAVPGVSGSQWPGGSAPASLATPTANPNYTVTATATSVDSGGNTTVNTGSVTFGATTVLQPAYSPEGGEFDFRRGSNFGLYIFL